MTTFPPEIWLHIGSLLPDAVLRKFLTVNRPLYHLSMIARHRVLDIRIRGMPKTMSGKLDNIRDRGLSKYIRILRLNFRPPIILPPGESSALEPVFLNALLDTIKDLDKLVELHVDAQVQIYENLQPFITSMWQSIKLGDSHLKNLHFHGDVQNIASMVPPYTIQGLQEIYLKFTRANTVVTNDRDPLSGTILPFLNHHSPSLHTLSIEIPESCNSHTEHMGQIFRKLKHFPHLYKLQFKYGGTGNIDPNEFVAGMDNYYRLGFPKNGLLTTFRL
ncbi:hypothetical protein BDQ17DRAFT_1323176 [Cyathus striatus]|nr:hypothetical protein BDQ17DRAFT_1323176 [Cyathus striatus]